MTDFLPDWARDGLERYIRYGIHTGEGLKAILENDLSEAMGRCCQFGGVGAADVWWIVSYLYNEAPSLCWGSKEKVRTWLERDWSIQRAELRASGGAT